MTGSRPERAPRGAPPADATLRRQVPTHLDVEDRAFAGLTVRQVLILASGAAWGYAVWCGWRQKTRRPRRPSGPSSTRPTLR